MRTYYKIISAGNSFKNNYRRGETRISGRKPEDHEMATGDQVFTLRAENIETARTAEKTAWTRRGNLEL
jgi:hypothetical protein